MPHRRLTGGDDVEKQEQGPRCGPRGWLAAAACLTGGAAPAATRCADVALVLAIDASGSISVQEFDMQVLGYVAALNEPAVWAAFRAAGTVDLAALFWADSAFGAQVIPWQRITTHDEAQDFALTLARTERRVSGNTDIGLAIDAAVDLLSDPDRCADRAIIDISGDGRSSIQGRRGTFRALAPARRRAEERGIVINALAISSRDPDLADYYRRHVATGPGSFVIEASGYAAFQGAISRKLQLELLSALKPAVCLDACGPG